MRNASLPPTAPPRARRLASKPLGELVNRTLDPLIAKQGFSETALLTRWDAIVGTRVGALCQPIRLNWPPRPRGKSRAGDARGVEARGAKTPGDGAERSRGEAGAATLVLRVEPGFGLDIQHSGAAIMERVNTFLGWRCVGRIAFKQEPLQRAIQKRREPPPPDPLARERASEIAEGFGDGALKEALVRLGERVLSKQTRR
ncbi:DUF721 domain-containing protein [Methylocystis heyeri]|uniref:DUF721 domain-containing protein n=1 Tax=Methylocystis heyeri TaxID=391905 RepID=A0A6B8KFQ2_9HYPH|nr:DciA family protein [Methylocystis heyeri]QGM46432.1 DUF721 domain-containing protein [Methylocystis heyeri]